jgi:hypothetical protein
MTVRRIAAISALALLGAVAFGSQSQASGVKVGVLTCNESSGWGFVVGSTKDINCTFSRPNGKVERYHGSISQYGVDIGYTQSAVIVWGVVAPTGDMAPGSLAGNYGGAQGSATLGIGAGVYVLIGGSANSIALQPVSVEGGTGLNLAGGIASMTLTPSK